MFVLETLRKHKDNLNPLDARLENTMKKLEKERKLALFHQSGINEIV
jgi:hypothetical protein